MKRVYRVKKLAKKEENAVIVRIFWLTVVSIVLIFTIFTGGVNFLGKFADLLGSIFTNENAEDLDSESAPPPPILDSLPHATNVQNIALSGFSSSSTSVEIYLDANLIDKADVFDGKFEYKNFSLKSGKNEISLKAVGENGITSAFSQSVIIEFDDVKPKLTISFPEEDQNFSGNNRIKVLGKTELEAEVFANGFLANVNDEANFEVTIPLTEGENIIEVKAQDEAGNSVTEKIKVHFKK